MPTVTITTNVSKDKIPDGFLQKTAQLVAEVLNKPLSYVVVHILPDQMMSWGGGTNDPCALTTLGSIGNLGRKENVKISDRLSAHIDEALGVKPDRMYINFVDYKRENVGYAGTTFADM